MIENDTPVRREPRIGLDPVGTELQGQPEGCERVLRGVGTSTPVTERNRDRAQ